jgi:hypothetical protein
MSWATWSWQNHRSPSAGFQGVLTVAAKSLQSDRIVHGLEQQPCGVQVVEGVGLVTSGLQFTLGLAAVFAEEVGGFGSFNLNGHI